MTPTDRRFYIDDAGWCRDVPKLCSPNFDARPPEIAIDLLVIHNISLPPGEFGGKYIDALFTNQLDCSAHPYFAQLEGLRVSAHFLIGRDGSATQFVSTHDRAWHAGTSTFGDRERCNDFLIGIELEGDDHTPFCDVQYATLVALTEALINAHPLGQVTGHENIAPGRKTDPGPHFDWGRYQSETKARFSDGVFEMKTAHLPRFRT
jgi:AmpD protein